MPTTFPGHGMEPVTGSRSRWKASAGGRPQSEPFSRCVGTDWGYRVYTFSIPPTLLKPGDWNTKVNRGRFEFS